MWILILYIWVFLRWCFFFFLYFRVGWFCNLYKRYVGWKNGWFLNLWWGFVCDRIRMLLWFCEVFVRYVGVGWGWIFYWFCGFMCDLGEYEYVLDLILEEFLKLWGVLEMGFWRGWVMCNFIDIWNWIMCFRVWLCFVFVVGRLCERI